MTSGHKTLPIYVHIFIVISKITPTTFMPWYTYLPKITIIVFANIPIILRFIKSQPQINWGVGESPLCSPFTVFSRYTLYNTP